MDNLLDSGKSGRISMISTEIKTSLCYVVLFNQLADSVLKDNAYLLLQTKTLAEQELKF